MVKILTPILSAVEQASQAGLKEAGREALAKARAKVPVDDGKLRRSGRVITEDLAVTVRFTAPHAWLQHERMDYRHENGGEAKYLENAALDTDVGRIVADAVRQELGGG